VNNSRRTFISLVILACILPMALHASQSGTAVAAVLTIDKTNTGPIYSINGKQIDKNKGLLLSLSEVRDADPSKDPELILMVSEQTRFADVTDVMGIAGKARYFNFRVLIFDKQKRVLYELTYSKGMPFSGSGAVTGVK